VAADLGNDPGWLITFHGLTPDKRIAPKPLVTLSRGRYYGSIESTLASGLSGSLHTIGIEQLSNDEYAALSGAASPLVAKLHLFWRDTNRSLTGYLANVAGLQDALAPPPNDEALVAVLAVHRVYRKADDRRITTWIEAYDFVSAALASPITATFDAADFSAALKELEQRTGLSIHSYGLPPSNGHRIGADVGTSYAEALRRWANALAKSSRKWGRGMLLVRNGEVHVGVRKVPLRGEVVPLTAARGLVDFEALEVVGKEGVEGGTRKQFQLQLKGRPDLKPGDVVKFELPLEEAASSGLGEALLGAMRGSLLPSVDPEVFVNPVTLYVSSVQHKLGRTTGFITTLTGVVIDGVGDAWDEPPANVEAGKSTGKLAVSTAADAATRAGSAIRELVDSLSRTRLDSEIAEVRAFVVRGSEEPPSQTSILWRGSEPGDGLPFASRRLSVRHGEPSVVSGAPYLTPFAWGKCGLVLPRYPGTRVLLEHRAGDSSDPVDLGALWESGQGPESEAGDYWLSLPVGVATDHRERLDDSQNAEAHTGKVSHDLIDADGNRVIEVGKLTIRVGADRLGSAGTRPSAGSEPVTIEHEKARITIAQDGTISIESQKDITFKADGDIRLEANSVKVKVITTMDVS
jgi:hypothetical protein